MQSMTYAEFLDTCKVIRMLYGRAAAEIFFTKNKVSFKVLDNVSVSNLENEKRID